MLDYRSVVTQDLLRQDIHLLENSSNQLCIPSIHDLGEVAPSMAASSKQHSGACSTEAKRHRNETSTVKSPLQTRKNRCFWKGCYTPESLTWEEEHTSLQKEKHLPNLQFLGFHVGFWECKTQTMFFFFRRFAFGISLIPHKHNNKDGPRIHEKKTTLPFHPVWMVGRNPAFTSWYTC